MNMITCVFCWMIATEINTIKILCGYWEMVLRSPRSQSEMMDGMPSRVDRRGFVQLGHPAKRIVDSQLAVYR